jgi:Tat protein secretion system quality control protein TatD with DNase activity
MFYRNQLDVQWNHMYVHWYSQQVSLMMATLDAETYVGNNGSL